MTRGSVPIRAVTLREAASAVRGRTGAGSTPIPGSRGRRSRPAMRWCVLGPRRDQRFSGAVARARLCARRSRRRACGRPRRPRPRRSAGPLAGFGDVRVLGGQPPAGLGHDDAADARGPAGSASRWRASVRPIAPRPGRCRRSARAAAVSRCRSADRMWPSAASGPVKRRTAWRRWKCRAIGACARSRVERPGGQVRQQRASVEQQELADHLGSCRHRRWPRYPHPPSTAATWLERLIDGVGAEHQPGQV